MGRGERFILRKSNVSRHHQGEEVGGIENQQAQAAGRSGSGEESPKESGEVVRRGGEVGGHPSSTG